MTKKINIIGKSVMIKKEFCSEIIPPKRFARALMKDYTYEEFVKNMYLIYEMTVEESSILYLSLSQEKEFQNGRPSVLTEPQRAFIEQNREKTGKELYELLRSNMSYLGSLKTVQNELTKIRRKYRVDFG